MILRIFYYLSGLFLLALGITLTLISDLGAGGWDALVENLYKLTDIRVGNWVIIVAVFLLVVAAILKRKFINYKALVVSIILGKLIDLCYYPLGAVLRSESFTLRITLLGVGLIMVGAGCAMMFVTRLPKNHTETFVFSIVDTSGIPYHKVKTGADVTALALAVMIGLRLGDFSNLGLGTVVSSFFMGSIIHIILPFAEKGYNILEKLGRPGKASVLK